MVAEVDMTSKRIFYKSNHPDVFCKKGAREYLANFTGKHLYKTLFSKEVWDFRPATLFQKRLMYRLFFCEMFKTLQNCFFIVRLRNTASDLIEYLETLTINCDLLKCLKILTIVVHFLENIWNLNTAMKQSEKRI